MVLKAATIWRDFTTDGVAASGTWDPRKPDIREWTAYVEQAILGGSGGAVVFATKAEADANLDYDFPQEAWVLGDPVVANNGIYQKQGASGAGSWLRLGDLPYSFIRAVNAGAGTADAIQADTDVPIPAADGGALISLNIVADNTADAPTVQFNGGGTVYTITDAVGTPVSDGGLSAGMLLNGYIVGTTFRVDMGPRGWSPLLRIVHDGARRVVELYDWTGGHGAKPTETGYLGATGIVSDIAQATDIRGPEGPNGPGTGDMLKSVYDPQDVEGDVFDGANLHDGTVGTDQIADEAITEAKVEDAFLATIARARDTDLTVQIPTDYPTLQAAVDALGSTLTRAGSRIFLEIEDGHLLTNGLFVRDGDYSRFWITYEGDLGTPGDATVSLDAAFVGVSDVGLFADDYPDNLIMGYNAAMPVLACKIDMNNTPVGNGYYGVWNCTGFVQPFCGVINAGKDGIKARASRFSALRTVWDGANESGLHAVHEGSISALLSSANDCLKNTTADLSNSTPAAIWCSRRSSVYFDGGSANNSGSAAVVVGRGSTFSGIGGNYDDSAKTGIIVRDASQASIRSSSIVGTKGLVGNSQLTNGCGLSVESVSSIAANAIIITGSGADIGGALDVVFGSSSSTGRHGGATVVLNGATLTGGTDAAGILSSITLNNLNVTNSYGTAFWGNINEGPLAGIGQFSDTGGSNGKTFDTLGGAILDSSRNSTSSSTHQRFYNPNGVVGTIITAGTSTAYNETSDEAWKDFIGAYDPEKAIEIIRADPVRDFHWKPEKGGGYAVGWGAQTSHAVSPDLASPGGWFDAEGNEVDEGTEGAEYVPWGIDHGKRTPYVWAAMSWAVDKIEEQEVMIASLVARIEALEARVQALEGD